MTADYTLLFATTPSTTISELRNGIPPSRYNLERPLSASMHNDLKRDMYIRAASNASNNATHSNSTSAPLFETYNFLSPGEPRSITAGIVTLECD